MENNQIVEKVEQSIKELYEELKEGCKTYGEFRKNIDKEVGSVAWSNPSVGMCLKQIMAKLYNEEIENINMCDLDGQKWDEERFCKMMNEVERKLSKECSRNNNADQILSLAQAINEIALAKSKYIKEIAFKRNTEV